MITKKDITAATMWINDTDISDYGALVESFSVGETPVTPVTYQGLNSTAFNLLTDQFGMREITVNLFFAAKTRRALTLKKSKVDSLAWGKIELKLPDGFYYTAVCTSPGDLLILGIEDNKVIGVVPYTFSGIRHDPLITQTGNTIDCLSTMPYTNARMTCTASRAYASITIAGVTITGVNSGDVLTIDGILGRILQNNAPCAGNMSFIKFPQLVPGVQTIDCPETLTIEYYPTYI